MPVPERSLVSLLISACLCAGCWVERGSVVREPAPAPEVVQPLPAPREAGEADASVPRYRIKRLTGWRAQLEDLLPREFSPKRVAARVALPTVAALISDLAINPERKTLDASQVAALDALIVDVGSSLRAAAAAHSQCHHDALLRSSDAGRVTMTRSLAESQAFESEMVALHGEPHHGWISSQVLLPDDRAPGVLHLYVTRVDEPRLFQLERALAEEREALRETLRQFFAEL